MRSRHLPRCPRRRLSANQRATVEVLSADMRPVSRWIRRVTNGDTDRRVRATWRGIAPWAVGFGVQLPALIAARFVIRNAFDASELGNGPVLLLSIAPLGIASGLGLFVAIDVGKRLDGRSLSDYGVEISANELLDGIAGTAIGGLTYAVPTVLFVRLGEAEITAVLGSQVGDLGVVALATTVAIASFGLQAAFEEFAFRGAMLRNFAEGVAARRGSRSLSVGVSLLTSALIFGVSHVIAQGGGGAEGRSLQLVLTSALLGVLWGGAYVLTGQLSIPFGLHFGHNLWAAVVVQPAEVALGLPALGQVTYAASRYELAVGKVLVGAFCLVGWLYLTRGEVTVEGGGFTGSSGVR